MKSYTENIEKYIAGELFGDELKTFETQLNSNRELYEDFLLHTEINKAIKEEDIMDLRNKLSSVYERIILRRERIIKLYRNIAMAAAIALIFVIGGVYFYKKNYSLTNQQLYVAFYSPYESIKNSRDISSTTKSILDKALDEYSLKDYSSAHVHFELFLKTNPDCTLALFYSSVTEMETGDYTNAINKLEHLLKIKDSLLNDQAEWYLGLCYLKVDNNILARIIFEKIANGKSCNSEKAKKLLRKFKNPV